jgi:putative phosphoesterase
MVKQRAPEHSGRVIGLIADTHGQIRSECAKAMAGVDLILHAGDVGGTHVLAELERIAPVRAVYGNTDVLASGLPASLELDVDGVSIHVSHGHELGSPTPARLVQRYGADVIVYGHTHRALVERIGRQLIVNPGAAGPARFRLVPSVGRLVVRDGEATVDLVALV